MFKMSEYSFIAGLLAPARGTVALDGQVITAPDPRVGLVFQEPRLLPWRTTAENICYPLELAGWDYPKHLQDRAYGVFVHGDVAGVEPVRRALCDWLDWMGLVDAGAMARLDRYIGYYRPYADSREEAMLDALGQRFYVQPVELGGPGVLDDKVDALIAEVDRPDQVEHSRQLAGSMRGSSWSEAGDVVVKIFATQLARGRGR